MSGSARSVVQIEVDDAQFKRFKDLFDRYQTALNDTTKAWGETGTAAGEATDQVEHLLNPAEAVAFAAAGAAASHEKIASLLSMQTSVMHQIGEAQTGNLANLAKILEIHGRNEDATKRQVTLWHSMVDTTKSVWHNITGITENILKWGALPAGLLGAGGLFGLDRLAGVAGGWRRTAQGLGLGGNAGEVQAFGTAFSRYVDPNAFLSGIQEALQDPAKRLALTQLGLGGAPANANVGDIGAQVLSRLPDYVRRQQAQGMPLETIYEKGRFGELGLSFQDFVRLGQVSNQEMTGQQRFFGRGAQELGITDDMLRRWQNFQQTLSLAGKEVEKTLIVGLANLTEPISRLSNAVVKLVENLMQSDAVKYFITLVAQATDRVAAWIGALTPADIDVFMSKVKDVTQAIVSFGEGIIHFVEWLDQRFGGGPAAPPPEGSKGIEPGPGGHWTGPGNQLWQNPSGKIVDPQTGLEYHEQNGEFIPPSLDEIMKYRSGIQNENFETMTPGFSGAVTPAVLSGAEAAGGLPAGTLAAVEWAESRGNARAVSSAGALGAFQFMPGTARDLGINPWDPVQSAEGAGRYLGGFFQKYGGDLAKALAAYNEGPGNLDKQIARWGAQWMQHLPQETSRYVEGIMRSMAKLWYPTSGGIPRQQPVHVKVTAYNNTGGSAALSVGQVSAAGSI